MLKSKYMARQHKTLTGFTLIELSFAVLFIAILLLTVALITSQIVGAYRKGVSMKTINQVGREIIEDVRTSITNSPSSFTADLISNPKLTYQAITTTSPIHSGEANVDISGAMLAGVFCTGSFSYIWNTGYRFSSDYTVDVAGTRTRVTRGLVVKGIASLGSSYIPHLLRISDPERQVCQIDHTLDGENEVDLTGLTNPNPTELISSAMEDNPDASRTDAPVALYDFYISTPPAHTATNGRLFYSGSFILGTTSGGVNVTTAGNNCQIPDGQTYANSNFNYCAVNKFNFAAQSTNTK